MSKGNHPPKGAIVRSTTSVEVKDSTGRTIATQVRKDYFGGYKDFEWWRNGIKGLNGFKEVHIPLWGGENFGSVNGPWVICEGAKATRALIGKGIPALAVMLGGRKGPNTSGLAFLQ